MLISKKTLKIVMEQLAYEVEFANIITLDDLYQIFEQEITKVVDEYFEFEETKANELETKISSFINKLENQKNQDVVEQGKFLAQNILYYELATESLYDIFLMYMSKDSNPEKNKAGIYCSSALTYKIVSNNEHKFTKLMREYFKTHSGHTGPNFLNNLFNIASDIYAIKVIEILEKTDYCEKAFKEAVNLYVNSNDVLQKLKNIQGSNELEEKLQYKKTQKTRELIKMAKSMGFDHVRSKGDHDIYRNAKGHITVIPAKTEQGKGLANKILKQIHR